MTEILLAVERDEASAPFFDAADRGELVVRSCAACGQLANPQATMCPSCGNPQLGWTPVRGTGTLVTWSVVARAPIPAFADAVPYVTAIVELDEGLWMYARLVGIGESALRAGIAVSARFVRGDDGDTYPVFGP